MSLAAHADAAAPFSAEGFRRRAEERLSLAPPSEPPDGALPARGDHTLTPEFAALVRARPPRPAAVLVPVVAHAGEATVLLTQRTATLTTHAGQIAFPGGKIDAADSSPLVAALREAEEEIGLDRDLVTPLGYLDLYLSRTGFRIVPVVGLVEPGHPLTPNPAEVDDVFEVPLAFLMTPGNHATHSRLLQGQQRRYLAMPWRERYIWGITAGILRNLYDRLYAA